MDQQNLSSTLLLNDTSDYHYGCKKVVESFNFKHSFKTREAQLALSARFQQYTKVILNGEGTMHHSSTIGIKFLDALNRAVEAGCEVQLLNTVWQDMPNHPVLSKCSRITVREPFSCTELYKYNIKSEVYPDRCLIHPVEFQKYPHIEIYRGQYFNSNKKYIDYPRINIFEQDWNEVVNRLRHSNLLITGRHHEMYAAIKARCKFVVVKGNSWKNEGLLRQFGLDTGMSQDDILTGKYDSQFNELFDYCDTKSKELGAQL